MPIFLSQYFVILLPYISASEGSAPPQLYPKHLAQAVIERSPSTFPVQFNEATQPKKLTTSSHFRTQDQDLSHFPSSHLSSSVDSQRHYLTTSGAVNSPTSFYGIKGALPVSPRPRRFTNSRTLNQPREDVRIHPGVNHGNSLPSAPAINIIYAHQLEPTFQVPSELSRLTSPPPTTFPSTQVAFDDAFVQDQIDFNSTFVRDTASRHPLHPFPQHSPEETTDWTLLLQPDGVPIVPPSQGLPVEHSETTLPMQYQTYRYDTPSMESSVNPMPYDFTAASAALLSEVLNGFVNEETSYAGRQTQAPISSPDVFNVPPLPLSSKMSEAIRFTRPNHVTGIIAPPTLPPVHVQHSLLPGFLAEYHNPTTVMETQDSVLYSMGLTHGNGLTLTSLWPVFPADHGFDVISPSRNYPQENAPGPQSADESRACYKPTPGAVSYTQGHSSSTSLNSPHCHTLGYSSSKAPNHQELLERAFHPHSASPNEARAQLLRVITRSSFIKTHKIEPSIDSKEGQALLKNIWDLAGCPPMASQKSNLSIYTLLLDIESRTCLICKSSKTSLDRAIGCVRSHLDHRPFVCDGSSVGCGRCKDYARPRRFFCLPYVVDHLKGQSKKFKCPYLNCETSLRRGGMVRHWNRKHSDSPFPKELFSGYGKRKKENPPPL